MDSWRERAHKLGHKRLTQQRQIPQDKSFWADPPHTIPFREQPEFLRGRAAEQRVATWLQERGWYVNPTYDYAGDRKDKPPRLQGIRNGYAIPDLDAAKDGTRRWVEVKAKSDLIHWRMTGKDQHGINHHHWQHYQTVEKITGTPCWIAIYEEWNGSLLAASLVQLGDPRIGLNTADGVLMANWDRDRFQTLHIFPMSAQLGDRST